MTMVSRSLASLQVMGDALDPDAVTARLGCQPTHSHAKGEVVARQGKVPPRTAPSGMWSLIAAETSPADVDGQVAWLLDQCTTDLEAWAWVGERYQLRLFCGWFMDHLNEGLTISATSLERLGQRGVLLDIDLYGPGD
jgi:hypothetical protein